MKEKVTIEYWTCQDEHGWSALPKGALSDHFSGWGRTKKEAINAMEDEFAQFLREAGRFFDGAAIEVELIEESPHVLSAKDEKRLRAIVPDKVKLGLPNF
jgi:hypothetical protein